MTILKTTTYTGPNSFSKHSVTHYIFAVEEMEDVSLTAPKALLALSENAPSNSRLANFVQRVSSGETPTWQRMFLEIFFRVHEIMGISLEFAEIQPTEQMGHWRLAASVRSQNLSQLALNTTLIMYSNIAARKKPLSTDEIVAIQRQTSALVRKARLSGLNFDSEAFVRNAEQRGIPWYYIGVGILELGHGRLRKRVRSAVTSETSLIAAKIAGDKATTAALLGKLGLPVPKQELARSLAEATSAASRIGFPVVLKPLSGSEGKGVTANIHNSTEIESAYHRARQYASVVIVESFIPGKDFRILVVDDEAIATVERIPAHVVGDGKNDIQTLVATENMRPRRDGRLLYKIKLNETVEEMLERQGCSLQSIPQEGETVFLRSTANFSTGGVPLDVTDMVHPDNKRMAIRAAKAIGLDVVGVDFITPDITRSYKLAGGAICEVNALPGLRLHIAPETGEKRDVAGKILETLFPEDTASSIPITAVFGHHSKQVTAYMLTHLLSFCGKTVGFTANHKAYVGGEQRNSKAPLSTTILANQILRDPGVDAAIFEVPFRELLNGGLGFEPCNVAILLGLRNNKTGVDASQEMNLAAALRNVLSIVDNTVIVNADDPSCVDIVKDIPPERIFYISLRQDNAVIEEHIRLNRRALFFQPQGSGDKIMLHLAGSIQPFLDVAKVPVLNRRDRAAKISSAMCASAAALSMGGQAAQLARGLEILETPFLSAASGVMEFQHKPFTVLLSPALNNGLKLIASLVPQHRIHNKKVVLIPASFLLAEVEDNTSFLRSLNLVILHGSKSVRQPAITALMKQDIPREKICESEDEDAALLITRTAMQPNDWLAVFSDNLSHCHLRLIQQKTGTTNISVQEDKAVTVHPLWTGKELALATGGKWIGDGGEGIEATGVCYYRGQLQPGDVFITTSPEHWKKKFANTIPYLKKMFDKGAAAAIVDSLPQNPPKGLPILLVDNTREALNNLGRFARWRLKGKAICVTGSAGKSTTKEMLHFVLGCQGITSASKKNFNHGDGVPLSIAQTPAEAAYGVYEFCVDAPAVTLPKAMIARPDVVIVTTIEHDHLMFYKTLEGVADQKSLLFDGLLPGGVVILNQDNPLFGRLREAAMTKGVRRIINFGIHPEADVRATSFEMSEEGSQVSALIHGTPVEYTLTQPGRHMIMNSLAALAAVEAVGGDVEQAAADMVNYTGLSRRVERHRVEVENGHFDIIDDSFSANPASIRAGLDVLNLTKPGAGGRRLALLGAIKELGKDSPAIHAALADAVKAARVERLFTIGDDMLHLRNKLPKEILAAHGDNGVELATAVAVEIRAGDVILVKGSLRTPENTAPTVQALLAKSARQIKKKLISTEFDAGFNVSTGSIPQKYAPRPAIGQDTVATSSRIINKARKQFPQVLWTGEELAQATGGKWLVKGSESIKAYGVCIYCQQARKGDVFITTNKQKWGAAYLDNYHCLKDLPSRGVAAAIVDFVPDSPPPGFPLLMVENTRDALDALGRYARQRIKGKVICITGSSGKSTTKEALKFVLARQGPTTASRLNFNHDEGIPLSLAQTPADVTYGVYEYAADPPQPASRPPKYSIARPDVAIVTLIAPDHLMSYKTLDGVAKQKSMLFDGLEPGGCAILNRDDEFFDYLAEAARARAGTRIISFGTHPEADVRALSFDLESNGSRIRAFAGGAKVNYVIAQPGLHMIMNSLAALAAVYALGADIRKAAADLALFGGLPQRTERHRIETVSGWFDLIDDSFSTNPASIRAGLAVLKLTKPAANGRRIAVLGEIKELGDSSPRLHASLSQAIIEAGVDKLFTVGHDMRFLRETLPPEILGLHGSNGMELAAAVEKEVRAGDAVLVKGSLRSHEMTSPVIKALLNKKYKKTSPTHKKHCPVKPTLPGKLVMLEKEQRRDIERLEVVFVGDTSFGENYQTRCEIRGQGNILLDKGYEYPLERMKKMLTNTDLVIANLETPLTDLKQSPFQGMKSFVHWSDINHAPPHLLQNNIRVVGLANNHSFDYGPEGYEQTLDTLDRFGMIYFGAGRSPEEASLPLLLQAPVGDKNFKMAVIGAYDYSKASDDKYGCYAKKGRGGLCALDARAMRVIRELKQNDPDWYVIAFPHWGPNYKWKTAMQSRVADELLQAGADLVIGHGAHMLQEIELRQGKWIIFSIGNFMFNSPGRYKNYHAPPYSLLARLVLTTASQGPLQRTLRLYPIVTDNLLTHYQTRFVTDQEFEEVWYLLSEKVGGIEEGKNQLIRARNHLGHFFDIDLGAG